MLLPQICPDEADVAAALRAEGRRGAGRRARAPLGRVCHGGPQAGFFSIDVVLHRQNRCSRCGKSLAKQIKMLELH